jgi:hypothetical protein
LVCSHGSAYDFTEEATCINDHTGDVEFITCPCISAAYGDCQTCGVEVRLERARD